MKKKSKTKIQSFITALLLLPFLMSAQLQVISTGNVGIGTSTPSALLDVQGGNINVGSSHSFQIGLNPVLSNGGTSTNIFIGQNAGLGGGSGGSNTFGGVDAGYNTSTSSQNTAFGAGALYIMSTGTGYNCAFGSQSLSVNTGYSNSGFGTYSLLSNISGNLNCGIGYASLYRNTTGSSNTAIGDAAMAYMTANSYNTACGANSLYYGTGDSSVAIGFDAGLNAGAGGSNTFIGAGSNAGSGTYANSTAIGCKAITNGSDRMYLGNSTTTLWSAVASLNASDGRFKKNITTIVHGLAFINKLHPVTYNLDTKALDSYMIKNLPDTTQTQHQQGMNFASSTAILRSGFIAQEVQQAATNVGFNSSIVHSPSDDNDIYALSYEEFVVPLVKAVQELSSTVDSLKTVAKRSDSLNNVLQSQINACCSNSQQGMKMNNTSNYSGTGNNSPIGSMINNADLSTLSNSAAALYQNAPNPFSQQTSIGYFIPTSSQSASIMVFDLQGKLLKPIAVTNYGNGAITINGNELSPGMYVYSLVVDGKIIDTKRMILTQ